MSSSIRSPTCSRRHLVPRPTQPLSLLAPSRLTPATRARECAACFPGFSAWAISSPSLRRTVNRGSPAKRKRVSSAKLLVFLRTTSSRTLLPSRRMRSATNIEGNQHCSNGRVAAQEGCQCCVPSLSAECCQPCCSASSFRRVFFEHCKLIKSRLLLPLGRSNLL